MNKSEKRKATPAEKKTDLLMAILLFLWIGIPGFIVLQIFEINPMSVKVELIGIVYAILSIIAFTKVVNHFKVPIKLLNHFENKSK